jgi:hypothetical protein
MPADGLDGVAGPLGEALEFSRLEKSELVHDCLLPMHLGTLRIVERTSELVITLLEQAVGLEIAIVPRSCRVRGESLDLFKRALAEPLEGNLAKLPEELPV